jgi:hypothetical protein
LISKGVNLTKREDIDMSKVERRTFTNEKDDAMNLAKKELYLWLERKDIEVIRWQLIPILFPYKTNPLALGLSWQFSVELFIEYKDYDKDKVNSVLDISGIINEKVSIVKAYPQESSIHESGVVVGGYIKNYQLFLLVSCENGIREVSTEYGRNAIKIIQ